MRIAYFSPLPPAKTGIADYSVALLKSLSAHADVSVFSSRPNSHSAPFDPKDYDVLLYQLGNNPAHDFVYEAALRWPGVVVLHEANLHYLIADLTINKGEAESYWKEVARNGAPKTPHPDYRVPMLRSILERSRAAIVHSEAVERVIRTHGFSRPIARIPHGASVVDESQVQNLRSLYRSKLGLEDGDILLGVFGFLKPYKRIREVLRAFRRVLTIHPGVRLILVGERHPELLIDLPPQARHIDFVPLEDFDGYVAACDAIFNLRFPTVGESSGTLMRALGMGKAAVVSDIGSFRELPDNICFKVPVTADEDEYLFEYMSMLASQPDLRTALGCRARAWVEQHCSWDLVAQRYLEFLRNFETEWLPAQDEYVDSHRSRLERILSLTPPGGPSDWVLEMGSYKHIAPALRARLGYGVVRGSYLGTAGESETQTIALPDGTSFDLQIDHFDAEKDFYLYPSAHFRTVLCCELLEHLAFDPMHMMEQIHRILLPGGHLVLTTPNVTSLRATAAILQGRHPMFFPAYMRSNADPRHTREYTPDEIRLLLENSGFEVTHLDTAPFREELNPDHAWVEHLMDKYMLPREHRGECIYAVAKKIGPRRERYPDWLYA